MRSAATSQGAFPKCTRLDPLTKECLNCAASSLFYLRMNQSRRLRLALCSLLLPILTAPPASQAAPAGTAPETLVFFGTYTAKKSKGIYSSRLNLTTGRLSEAQLAAETPSPSFVAIHPSGRFLYAVNEVNQFKDKPAGSVIAYAIDPASGKLSLLNQQTSGGPGPCHVV